MFQHELCYPEVNAFDPAALQSFTETGKSKGFQEWERMINNGLKCCLVADLVPFKDPDIRNDIPPDQK